MFILLSLLFLFFTVPRSLVLYISCVLVIASLVYAYKCSHQPHLKPHSEEQAVSRRTEVMKALVAVDYGGPEVRHDLV